MDKIESFQGEYRWLSNFWPCVVVDEFGINYPSVEHAYQAAKTSDVVQRMWIRNSETPGIAKRRGKTLKNLTPEWERIKIDVMKDMVRQKFKNQELAKKLDDTADSEIIEGNTWGDTFWGVCRGRGLNFMGRILMEIRQENREKCNTTHTQK